MDNLQLWIVSLINFSAGVFVYWVLWGREYKRDRDRWRYAAEHNRKGMLWLAENAVTYKVGHAMPTVITKEGGRFVIDELLQAAEEATREVR